MAQKDEKDKKKKFQPPTPTYTRIDPNANKGYTRPTPEVKSNIVVSQADLTPVQTQPQARPMIQSKGALAALQPKSNAQQQKQQTLDYLDSPLSMTTTISDQRDLMSKGLTPGLPVTPPTGFLMNKLTPNAPLSTPNVPIAPKPAPPAPGRDIPIIGSVLKSLDKVQQATLPFAQGAASALGIPLAPTERIENNPINSTMDKILYGAGMVGGGFTNPAALEQNLVTQPYKAAGALLGTKAGQSLVNKIGSVNPLLANAGVQLTPTAINRGLSGALAGAGTGGAYSLISGQSDVQDVARNAALGAGIGAVGDVAFGAIGDVIGKIRAKGALSNLSQTSEAIPSGQVDVPESPTTVPSNTSETIVNDMTQASTIPSQIKFTTAKGSTYTVGENGATQRTKSLHQGHDPNDVGIKEPSEKTIYIDKDLASMVGAHGNLNSSSKPRIVIQDDGIYLVSLNSATGKWGRHGDKIPYSTTPEIGKSPLEFWNIRAEDGLGNVPKKFHAGNEITEIEHPKNLSSQTSSNEIATARQPIQSKGALRQALAPNERAFYSNVESTELTPEVRQSLADSTEREYTRITNLESVDKANARIDQSLRDAINFVRDGEMTAEKIATGSRAFQELQRQGNAKEAAALVDYMSQKLTNAGQVAQAARILQALTPEGKLEMLRRKVANLNERLPKNKQITITDEVEKKYLDTAVAAQAAGISEQRAGEVLQITTKLRNGETLSVAEKQTLSDFADDLKTFMDDAKPDITPPKQTPEMRDPRKRDRLISWLEQKATAAQQRLSRRRNTISANPFDTWIDMGIIAAAKMTKRSVKFADFASAMVNEFGEGVRPFLQHAYSQGKKVMKRESSRSNIPSAKKAAADAKRAAETATVKGMVRVTKDTIEKFKDGTATPKDVERLHEAAASVQSILKDPKVPNEEKQLMQVVKQLARKLEDAEVDKTDRPQAVKEIETLIRKVTQIKDELEPVVRTKPDNGAINKLAYELFDRAVPGDAEKVAIQFLRKNKGLGEAEIDNIRNLAQKISKMSGKEKVLQEMELQKILNDFENSSLWGKVQAIRYISMLFNTGTQAVNALSGPMMASIGTAADILPTMVDSAMSAILKKPRNITLYGTSPIRFMAQWFKNAKVGGKAGWHGLNPEGIAGQNDIRGLTFKGKNPVSFVPSMLERSLGAIAKGADYATYKTVQQSELRRAAYLDAKNKGVKGRQNVKEHIENFVSNPTEAALEQADKIARSTTFQRTDSLGGQIANSIAGFQGKASALRPAIGAVAPFIRTPINIASTAVSLTPAGLLKGLFQLTSKSQASQREALRTLGLGLTGTGLSALGYELSKAGIITGANDSGNKDVDAIREQAGRGKYRFNTSALMRYMSAMINGEGFEGAERAAKYQEGDKQFDYNKLQPIALPLALGAGFETQQGDVADKLKKAGTDAYGSLYGMSTLKGVQDVFQPSYDGTLGEKALGLPMRVMTSFLKSFSPSTLAQETRREDPIQRKTSYNNGVVQDVKEYFQSRTPGQSTNLPPNKTTLGQDKLNAPGIAGQYANPYKSDVAPYTKAAAFISDLIDRTGDESLAPSAPEKKVSGKDRVTGTSVTRAIPIARYTQLQEEIGNEIIRQIEAIPDNLTDEQKAGKVHQIYEDVTKKYRNIVKKELGIRPAK